MQQLEITPIDSATTAKKQGRTFLFKDLIDEQLEQLDSNDRADQLAALMAKSPAPLQREMGKWTERWMPRVEDRNFFYRDGGEVFDEIIADAREFLHSMRYNRAITEELLYDLYQMVLMNYAYFFEMDPQIAQAVGLRYTPPQAAKNVTGLRVSQVLTAVAACLLIWLAFQYIG